MEVKNQKQVLKLFSAFVIITGVFLFKEMNKIEDLSITCRSIAAWFRACSVACRILRNGSTGHFRITIWSTHLSNRMSVSVSETVYTHFYRIREEGGSALPPHCSFVNE